MASIIPEVLNHFNIYNGANALVGVSGEVELPELEAITDTVEGTGVLGEIEDPVTGQFSSATIKIPFAVLYSDMLDYFLQMNIFDLIDLCADLKEVTPKK